MSENRLKLLLTFAAHACEVDGRFYNCGEALISYKHLARYRQFMPNIVVAIRCKKALKAEPHYPRIDGEGITVAPIPDPQTPLKALLGLPKIIKAIIKAINSADRYYLKLPEPTATLVGLLLLALRKKYAVEVVADSKKGILFAKKKMPFVRFYASFFDGMTMFLVKRAWCATYVSEYLRKRYPTRSKDREWVFCSAELSDDLMGLPKSVEHFKNRPFRIFSAGRMSAEKGHIYLVRAFKEVCRQSDKEVELHLVGDGPERHRLEKEANELGIADKVHFHGYINRGPELFKMIEQSQLFIMPSLTEGMGRGMIEVIVQGIPVIGSNVDGIPEYLPNEALFEAGNPHSMAEKILDIIDKPEKLAAMSLRNYEAGKAFRPEALKAVKQEFWQNVIDYCK